MKESHGQAQVTQPGGFVFARLSGNMLSAQTAFTTFAVFNAMQFSVGTLPFGIRMVTEVLVALRRIKVLLASVAVEFDGREV